MLKPKYTALELVLIFNRGDSPALGWICADMSGTRWVPTSFERDGGIYVRVTMHEEEATAGRGLPTLVRHVQLYRKDLAAACAEWHRRRQQLDAEFEQLRRGKVPAGYLQWSLFD